MVRSNGPQSVERALRLMKAILLDQGQSSLTEIARTEGLPPATAYRLAASLVGEGMLLPIGRGRHCIAPDFLDQARAQSLRPALLALARPFVREAARATASVAHLGVLDDEMVTYLIKEGRGKAAIFTEEGKQLEAYCSGIGKVLLAALPEEQRSRYMANGPFVALTANTITDVQALRAELAEIRTGGFALDREEIAPGIHCLAVPIWSGEGEAVAALSISRPTSYRDDPDFPRYRNTLTEAAAAITARLRPSR